MKTKDNAKKRMVQTALTKTKDLTDDELSAIADLLDEKLGRNNMTRRDWLKDKDVDETSLSSVLAGRRKSRPLVQTVCKYILE